MNAFTSIYISFADSQESKVHIYASCKCLPTKTEIRTISFHISRNDEAIIILIEFSLNPPLDKMRKLKYEKDKIIQLHFLC